MAEAVYVLCALTSLLCAVLLLRKYALRRLRLLLWSGLCFVGLTVNNILLVADFVIYPGPSLDLSVWRGLTSTISVMILLYGLIWDAR
jgi:hypothetical protein